MPRLIGENAQDFDAIALLQASLEVTAEEAQDLSSVIIICTDPKGNGAQMPFGEFMAGEHGANVRQQVVETFKLEKGDGADSETALRRSLGVAARFDPETRRLLRFETQPTSDNPPEQQDRKKNEDKSEVEVVAETVEVRRSVEVKADVVEATVDITAQIEMRMPQVTPPELAAQLARERVENELARQILQAEVAMSERLAVEESAVINVTASEHEAEIIPLATTIVNAPENAVILDVIPKISNIETVEIAEPVEIQTDEPIADIIYLDNFRVVDEPQLDILSDETVVATDETEVLMADEGDSALAEIIYPEVWRDEAEVELEPLTVANFAKKLRELTIASNADVENGGEPQIELTPEMLVVNEQVATALEALIEPEKIVEAQDLLDKIMEAVQAFDIVPEADAEAAEKNLKLLCENLFVFLGIEYNEQMIEQFVRSVQLLQANRVAAYKRLVTELSEPGMFNETKWARAMEEDSRPYYWRSVVDSEPAKAFGRLTLAVA